MFLEFWGKCKNCHKTSGFLRFLIFMNTLEGFRFKGVSQGGSFITAKMIEYVHLLSFQAMRQESYIAGIIKRSLKIHKKRKASYIPFSLPLSPTPNMDILLLL